MPRLVGCGLRAGAPQARLARGMSEERSDERIGWGGMWAVRFSFVMRKYESRCP